MKPRFLMGLDAGGGSGRALLVNIATGEISSVTRPWASLVMIKTDSLCIDIDLEAVWAILGDASREVMAKASAAPGDVAGIAVTSMRHSTVILGKKGGVLLAVPNRDARAASTCAELAVDRGTEFHTITGRWPIPSFTAVRLKWLAEIEPKTLAQAHIVLSLSEWITYHLCDRLASDPSHAAETMLYDLTSRKWSRNLLDSLDLPVKILPKIKPSGKRLGKLKAAAAAHLGLKTGIPVSIGGGDTQCGLIGTGLIKEGQIGIIAGTTVPLQMVLDSNVVDPQGRLWTGRYLTTNQYILESNAGSMGEGLEWISKVLYPDTRYPEVLLDTEAARSVPGAVGLISSFGTQVFDGSQMGLPFGHLTLSSMLASDPSQRRAHIARAILEGMAFGVRANVEQLAQVSGFNQPEFTLAGGRVRSTLWNQILADVINQPLSVAQVPETSALGAAICAGIGARIFKDPAEGIQALVPPPHRLFPNAQAAEIYQDIYLEWLEYRSEANDANIAAGSLLMRGMATSSTASARRQKLNFYPKILVTAPIDENALERLRRLGDVTYQNYRETYQVLIGDDLVAALRGTHILVTEVDVVDADALAKLPDLRVVVSCRGNPVNIDAAACTAYRIPLIHTPGRNADAVADLTVAFMLMLARKLPEALQFLNQPGSEAGDLARMGLAHDRFQGIELWRKTLGLVGLGAIGQRVLRRVLSFGMRVLVYDPYVSPEEILLAGAEAVSLDMLLRQSDFVSLHAPVTPETTGLLGLAEFERMKSGAFLINTARAALTDESALVQALTSGHLAGAALDVFPVEPPGPDHPLLRLPNVIATPHIGGNSVDVSAHQGEMVADAVESLLQGERPRFLVNPTAFDSFSWTDSRPIPTAETLSSLQSGNGPAISDLDARHPEPASQPAMESPTTQLIPAQKVRETDMEQVHLLEKILDAFLAASEGDQATLGFAANRLFVMHYMLTDANLDFMMVFENGKVEAGFGPPPSKPDLTLKMKAEVFDGMMTGKINAMSAALSGKMKFSGDTAKAMQMQRIQKDLMRLYSHARAQIGDPGDLANLARPSRGSDIPASPISPPSSIPATQPQPLAHQTRPQAKDERHELVATALELYEKDLITATGGNLSVRSVGDPGQVWITPSAMFKGDLTVEQMVRINLEGEPLDEEAPTPSSERWLHSEILKTRPEIHAVIHAHAPWATLLALTETPFLPISTEAAFVGDIPVVPFIMPGTHALAQAVAEALGEKGVAVLMQNHGLVVAGSSLRRAASTTEVIERCAESILRCLSLGKKPPVLPEETVQSLREVGQMMA